MSQFIFNQAPVDGLRVIERQPISDDRGFFERIFCQETIGSLLGGKTIRQVNRTLTQRKGAVRGLHFQYPPYAEIKIVSCLRGQVWDVAVDLRRESPTFLKHHAVLLTEDNGLSYVIPEGFAHGFQTLTSDCEMLYFHTTDYDPTAEGALNAVDPLLSIPWPEPISERSERDMGHSMLAGNFKGLELP